MTFTVIKKADVFRMLAGCYSIGGFAQYLTKNRDSPKSHILNIMLGVRSFDLHEVLTRFALQCHVSELHIADEPRYFLMHIPVHYRSQADKFSLAFAVDAYWANANGDIYAIAHFDSDAAYYYKPCDQSSWTLAAQLEGITRARFLFNETSQHLHLITAGNRELRIRSISLNNITQNVKWTSLEFSLGTKPILGFSHPTAIYNQSRSYQTTTVDGIHFGVVGNYPDHDHKIYYFEFDDSSTLVSVARNQ